MYKGQVKLGFNAVGKYALLVLRAENDSEGGVFALYGLVHRYKNQGARSCCGR
jgi:K+ transporter